MGRQYSYGRTGRKEYGSYLVVLWFPFLKILVLPGGQKATWFSGCSFE